MSSANATVRVAIVGTLALIGLTACTVAQQSGQGATSSPAAAQVNKGRPQDTNLPPLGDQSGAPISWLLTNQSPWVHFRKTGAYCVYLGFNEKGSYIENQGDGKVYLWNLKSNSLTLVADNFREVSLNVLASLQNSDVTVRYWLAANNKSHQAEGPDQIYRGPQHDPNLPPLIGPNDAPIYWTYGSDTMPSVEFRGYPFSKDPSNQSEALYLGFNESGSLILNRSNLKLYYWKLINPVSLAGTLTMTLAVKSYKDVPLDLLASLQNPSSTVQETLAANGKAPQPIAIPPQQAPPQNPDKSGGLFGDNPQKALQNVAPVAGVPAEITGKNASVEKGVLIFTLSDGSKSRPYTVVRPGFMANAPQSADGSGTWVAVESGGNGILFTVQADHTVTGKEISPQVVQMLLQKSGPR